MMGSVLAAIGLILCLLALGHQLLSPTRQQRVNTHLRRAWFGLRAQALSVWQQRHWWRNRRAARQAADEAIARAARRGSERTGNVIKPDAFNKPRKPH